MKEEQDRGERSFAEDGADDAGADQGGGRQRASVPKRLRPFLHHRPRTAGAVLHILLRALQATLRKACPTAPASASLGAVSFLHRFGSSLNPHYHFHLLVVDGLFEKVEEVEPATEGADASPTSPNPHLRFHEATALTHELLESLQHTIRSRVLRHFIELSFASFDGLAGHLLGALCVVISRAARLRRHGLLEPHEADDMLTWDHGGGFSLDSSVRIEATDRAGLERLIRYCARPPFALERLHLVAGRSDQILYLLPDPDLAGRTALRLSALEFLDRLAKILPPPRLHRHRYHGVFAPNAPLRPLVTERAHQDNALAARNLPDQMPLPSPTGTAPKPKTPPDPDSPSPSPRPSRWAALLARIYETFPLTCPTCAAPLTFIALLTDPQPPTSAPSPLRPPSSLLNLTSAGHIPPRITAPKGPSFSYPFE